LAYSPPFQIYYYATKVAMNCVQTGFSQVYKNNLDISFRIVKSFLKKEDVRSEKEDEKINNE
jgi:hypothetical protein